MLKDHDFASPEEADEFLRKHVQERNRAGIDDFHGLSPEQMHHFLYFPFDSPQFVTFPPRLDIAPQAPILTLLNLMADAIGDQGLKPTATGNLPRNFCREAARTYWGEEKYKEWTSVGQLTGEGDFVEMHVTRIIAQEAKLIRMYKGKFVLTKECRKLLAETGPFSLYPRLFRVAAWDYNWAYMEYYGAIALIQQSFLFSLYLLKKYGDEWKSKTFYEDCFLRAFPNLVSEIKGNAYVSSEKILRDAYTSRCLRGFASLLGLVERQEGDYPSPDFLLKKLPLLDHVVQFHM